jgi:putative peptide zinc metalloprotease protein
VNERPHPASGIELLGELTDSGYRTPPSLVRRGGGQTVQLTPLLYLVLKATDGQRTFAEIADVVSSEYGRRLGAEDVQALTESQLRPLGLVRGADGTEPTAEQPNPLLALRLRWVVSDPRITRRITKPFAALFTPALVVVILLAFSAIAGWVLFTKGLASATHQAFDQPILLVVVFAITLLSAGFHEFGHASACRYGGATPGAMGTGLYLVWPAFYTDVTDSYRLSRGGRLRVDLGGLYFNAIVAVVMFAVWAGTGWDAILLILAAQLLQMVRQLAPMVRFDGYHVLADLTGVPDLYSRMGAILLSLRPGRPADPRVAALKRGPRIIVTAWVLVIVPLLLFTLLMMVLALPRVLGTAWASLLRQSHALNVDWAGGDAVGVTVRVLAIMAVALPILGSLLVLVRLVRSVTTTAWSRTQGRPVHRAVAGVTALAIVAGLASAWWPDQNRYRPIQPFEGGTVTQALDSASFIVGRKSGLQDGQIVQAQASVWASTSKPPTKDHPQLALVLIPKRTASGDATSTPKQPAWVFPFTRPSAPGPGGNQALAVNTKDGSTQYDIAFALVWADGTSVTNTNAAYAFASCRQCTTVAIAFQVVLITGSARVVIPQNLSGALNYSCVQCVTYALAQQLVLSVPNTLSAQERQRLDALWAQIGSFAATIKDLPLDQIRTQLLAYENQIQTIVVGAANGPSQPSTTSSSSPTSGASPAPSATGAPPSPTPSATTATPTAPATAPGAQNNPTGPPTSQVPPSPSSTSTAPTTSPSLSTASTAP